MSTTKPIRNKSQLNYFRNYYKNIEYNPRNYALIVLGLNSALRIGDLLTLHWNDIYNEHEKKYRKHITLIEKKTGKINTLLLNKSSREALELHRQTQTPMHSNGNDFVFQSQKSPYHNISLSYYKKSGIFLSVRRYHQLPFFTKNFWLPCLEGRCPTCTSYEYLQSFFLRNYKTILRN